MPYVELAQIKGRVPEPFLTQALDDDGDGVVDAWDAVAAEVAAYIDGILGMRYLVPFSVPLPAVVVMAAQILACEMCYSRRSISAEQNPKAKQADAIRGVLNKIAEGKAPLTPTRKRVSPSGTLISEGSSLYDKARRRLS